MPKQAKQKETVTIPELSGMVTVIGTDETPHLKTGQEYEVSAQLAKNLIAKGAKLKQ